MRLTTSWYKHEMMKQNFRQVGWISLSYLLVLFFALPLNIMMQLNQVEANSYYHYYSFFEFGIIIQVLMLFIIPVLMGMFVLRYLHQKDASDFLHSLPISRSKLFWQQVAFGFVGLWIPIIVNGLLIFLINHWFDTSALYQEIDLAYWWVISIVLVTFVYSVSLIIGVMTGITIIQGIFTFIMLFLPVGFTFLFVYNVNFIILGFPTSHFISDRLLEFSPITDIANLLMPQKAMMIKIVVYLFLAGLFLVKAQVLYKNRPAEATTQAIAFQMLKPIFIYSFTFCFTLIGGLYFGLFQQSYPAIIFGYLIFSIIGYFISQMIVHKTWRVFGEWREYGIFFVGFTLLFVLVNIDVIGFQNRIPNLENVESAFIIEDSYLSNYYSTSNNELEGFTNEQDIKLIQDYHQYLIDNVSRKSILDYQYSTLTIIYQLKNGKEVVREYNISLDNSEHRLLEQLKNDPVYKKYTNELFMFEPFKVNQIRFYTYSLYKELIITDQSQIVELIELLQDDILAQSDEGVNLGTGIEISYLNQEEMKDYVDMINLDLTKENERVIEWLDENQLIDQALILVDDVDSMVLAYSDQIDNYYEETDYYGADFYAETVLSELQQIEITDRDSIEEIFGQIEFFADDRDYLLALYLKDMASPYIVQISQSAIPLDILEQIN